MLPAPNRSISFVRALAVVVALGACGGVQTSYQATSGESFRAQSDVPSTAFDDAILASATRDIPCPRARITVLARRPILVAGCGYLVTYALGTRVASGEFASQLTLMGRAKIAADPGLDPVR